MFIVQATGQSTKTFLSSESLPLTSNKLECLTLVSIYNLVYYLETRPEPTLKTLT